VAEGWRRLYKENFHNVYTSPNIIWEDQNSNEMGGTHSTHKRDEKFIENIGRKT
jgi:hypothetical protein